MTNYLCIVNEAGPANSGPTSNPNIVVNLTDTGGSFTNTWFYAADGIQDQVLDTCIAAITCKIPVDVALVAPNPGGTPYTEISSLAESRPLQRVVNFTFSEMNILGTRSLFTDTDYITMSVAVGDAPAISKTLAMGSLSPGNYPVNLSIQVDMPETPPTAVSFAWSVVNKGDVDESLLQEGVEKALSALVKTSVATLSKDISQPIGAALGAAIGAAIGTAAISLTGSAIVALAGYVLSQVIGILFADCDGTITTGLRVYTNTQIVYETMSGDDVIRDIVLDLGTDSAVGCGANSEYQTTTLITSIPRIVPTFNINGHYTVNGQPGPIITTSGNSIAIDMSFSGRPNATGTILNSNVAQFVFTDDNSVPNGTYTVQIDPQATLYFVESKSSWTKASDVTTPVSIRLPVFHKAQSAAPVNSGNVASQPVP